MKYLSTFSGIGGFELGIKLAYGLHTSEVTGLEGERDAENLQRLQPNDSSEYGGQPPTCVGFSEIDKYAISVYQKQFPTHKNYGDITKINARELPDFDLLIGGFPCQSFSVAGQKRGFDDTRGTMFFELARIIKEKRPRLFLFENVKGLLSHDQGRTIAVIIATLDELGYDCQWQVLNSKSWVPQNRERIYIAGHLRGEPRPQVFPLGDSDKKHIREADKQGCASTLTSRSAGGTNRRGNVIIHNVYDGFGEGVREFHDYSPTIRTSAGSGHIPNFVDGAKIRRLTPIECERLQGFPESKKSCIIEVCLDPQKSYVSVVSQNLKLQRLAGSAEKNSSQENVSFVEKDLDSSNPQTNKPAQPDVLIDCVENGVEIHSQGKLLLNAKDAEKKNWFHPHIKLDDFVQLLVGLNIMSEREIGLGKEELHQNEDSLIHLKNGLKQENSFGNEIMLPVGDVENDLITLKELLRFTTLDRLDTESSEQRLKILSLFVTRAISGFIPREISSQNIFTIEVKTKVGYTYGVSDTQRYKMLGNAVTVNTIEKIMQKLL